MTSTVTKRNELSLGQIEILDIEDLEVKQDITFSHPSFKNAPSYLVSRFTTLFPSRRDFREINLTEMFNPFNSLGELNGRQWNFFLVGFLAWVLDLFDFFCISLNVSSLAEDLDKSVAEITWGITLVLMLRSVGAIIFGIWADRYGRKLPYIVNVILLIILQLGLGFIQTYKQFLAVRALFGIAMGGIYGNCVACALDDCPLKARGVLSGIFQEGYSVGYLLAVIFQRAIADTTRQGWRSLVWFSAGLGVLVVLWRLMLPETDAFIQQQSIQKEKKENLKQKIKKIGDLVKLQWLVFVYIVLLMAGFNFMSHGSQDLYPTLLTKQYNFSNDQSTVTNVVANLGAICGGIVFGHASNYIGRRLTAIIASIVGGATIYPWAFINGKGINAGAFFQNVGMQGAFSVAPVYSTELSIPQHRAFIVGIGYQLGNLCSSASSTIEATIGERFPIKTSSSEALYNYAKVMSMGCVYGYIILIAYLGPETRNTATSISNEPLEGLDPKVNGIYQKA